MTNRRRRQYKGDDLPDPLVMTITDAVKSASEAADETGADIHRIISGRSGLGAVFEATMGAVADTEPGNIGLSVFDAAMSTARNALINSAIPPSYDRVRRAIESIPDRLVQVAARQAASDMFAEIPVRDGSAGGERLLDRMKTAAVRAAKAHLKRDDEVVLQATADALEIADQAIESTSRLVLLGVPVHAATVAVFEVAIRGVPPHRLADAIEEACRELPKLARRHDDLVVGLVGAISTMIAADAVYRRKYQTAIRGAEELSRNEATDRIVDEITGNVFEGVYMALVLSVYANSDGSVFESGYEEALAAACGMDSNRARLMRRVVSDDPPPKVDGKEIPQEVYLELQQRLASTMDSLLSYGEDPANRKKFMTAMNVDYKAAASSGQMTGIISLYEMAYRAGYEGAGAAVGEKSRGTSQQQRQN